MAGMDTHPAIAIPQAAENESARGGNPIWFRWEIIYPLVAFLALFGSLVSLMDRLQSPKTVRH